MTQIQKYNNKFSNLINTTAVYMVGIALCKCLNFLILPYISRMITSEQLGIYDVIQTVSGLLVPIITLQVIDAAFRFTYEVDDSNKSKVLTNIWFLISIGILVLLIIGGLINKFIIKINYFYLLEFYTVSNVIVNMFQRIARSYDLRKVYVFSGIIQTVVLLFAQLLFLKFTNLNEKGLVFAYVIAVIVTCVYIEKNTKSFRNINYRLINKKSIKEVVKFSAPLVPNSISWWGVSSVGRIIIITYIGYKANGIYSMSNKFAGLVTTITSTFLLAYQEYAISEQNKQEKPKNSIIFNHFINILAIGTSLLLLLQQIYFNLFINEEYVESMLYIPIIMLSMFFSSISSFYGTGYFVHKNTTGALKTTIFGAVINITLSFLLVNRFKLWGIALASMFAYVAMCLLRHFSMKHYFTVKVKPLYVILCVILLAISSAVFYVNSNVISLITIILICTYTLLFYGKDIIQLLKYAFGRKNDNINYM